MENIVYILTMIILLFIMAFNIYCHFFIKKFAFAFNNNPNGKLILVSSIICLIGLVYNAIKSLQNNNNNIDQKYLILLGITSVVSLSLTVYYWKLPPCDADAEEEKEECSFIIPTSNIFSDSTPIEGELTPSQIQSENYDIYRAIYLLTLIVLVILLQLKLNNNTLIPPAWGVLDKNIMHYLLFLSPIILPFLTEIFTFFTNLILYGTTVDPNYYKLTPEALLLNFIKGDSGKALFIPDVQAPEAAEEWGSWLRSIMPILLYFILMVFAILSGMGKVGTDGGTTATFIIAGFLIFFTFIMRTVFVQDCSRLNKQAMPRDGEVSGGQTAGTATTAATGTRELDFSCVFEKYGGLQTMLNICLIIVIMYHIDNPNFKLIYFTILMLASWGLSQYYILNFAGEGRGGDRCVEGDGDDAGDDDDDASVNCAGSWSTCAVPVCTKTYTITVPVAGTGRECEVAGGTEAACGANEDGSGCPG